MRRLLSLTLTKLAVVWLVFAISSVGILESIGDCAFEGDLAAATTGVCLHGDSGRHEQDPAPCTTDHHGATQCVCSCHIVGIVPATTSDAPVQLVQALAPLPVVCVPERREPPVLRPPIAG